MELNKKFDHILNTVRYGIDECAFKSTVSLYLYSGDSDIIMNKANCIYYIDILNKSKVQVEKLKVNRAINERLLFLNLKV